LQSVNTQIGIAKTPLLFLINLSQKLWKMMITCNNYICETSYLSCCLNTRWQHCTIPSHIRRGNCRPANTGERVLLSAILVHHEHPVNSSSRGTKNTNKKSNEFSARCVVLAADVLKTRR